MTSKEEWAAKTARLERAGKAAEAFVAAGGDLKSKEAVPLGMELINAFNEVSTLFGHPILKPIDEK
jgi:hypothetical protein